MIEKGIFYLLLMFVSIPAFPGEISLDCSANIVDSKTPGASAIVQRDATSMIVETDVWVSSWSIENRATGGFEAHIVDTDWKPVTTHARIYQELRDIQSLSIRMAGPEGGFRAGKRYLCAMSQELSVARY